MLVKVIVSQVVVLVEDCRLLDVELFEDFLHVSVANVADSVQNSEICLFLKYAMLMVK